MHKYIELCDLCYYVRPVLEKVVSLTGIVGIDIGYFEQIILFVLFLIFIFSYVSINGTMLIQYCVTSSVFTLHQMYNMFRDNKRWDNKNFIIYHK